EAKDGHLQGPHVRVDGKDEPVVLAAIAQALEHTDGGKRIHAESAKLGRDGEAVHTHARALEPAVAIELALLVDVDEAVVQLVARKLGDLVAQVGLLVGPGEVHRYSILMSA